MAYLDHAATTPVRPSAARAWAEAPPANPSSLHASGRRARRALEEAREELAEGLGVPAGDVILTAGGTASDNAAITGIHRARRSADPRCDTVVVSAVEHHAVIDTALALPGARVLELGVDAQARVDPDQLRAVLAAEGGRISLVSVMSANNEVGSVQPVAELAEVLAGTGVPLHVDAVQSAGWWGAPLAPGAAVTISGHKFGAPIGIGALVLPASVPCAPVVHGGGQERRLYSGTLNVAGAAAMAAALTESLGSGEASGEPGATVSQLREELRAAVLVAVPDARVATPAEGVIPGIVNVVFDGCDADALLMLLDAAGVECSTGSACTAGIPEPSRVLAAMGADAAQARSALRFSLGWTSTRADIDALAGALPAAVARARRASAAGRRAS